MHVCGHLAVKRVGEAQLTKVNSLRACGGLQRARLLARVYVSVALPAAKVPFPGLARSGADGGGNAVPQPTYHQQNNPPASVWVVPAVSMGRDGSRKRWVQVQCGLLKESQEWRWLVHATRVSNSNGCWYIAAALLGAGAGTSRSTSRMALLICTGKIAEKSCEPRFGLLALLAWCCLLVPSARIVC